MISLLFSLLIAAPVHAEMVEKTVAIVNSEVVLESDVRDLKKRLAKPGMVDDSLLFDRTLDSLKTDRAAQLDYLINEKVLDSEIKRLNLTVTSDRVDQEIKDLAKRNNISQDELMQAIKGQGVTPSEYRAFLKEKIEKQSLMDTEIISKLRISDEDALHEYLKDNPKNKPAIDEFSVSHIFFSPKKGGPEAAHARAELVLKKLHSGSQTFEDLAQQFSEDPNFSAGGSLGTFKSGEFLPEIEDAIAPLKVGEITPIVKSHMGYHIVKLTSKKLTPDPKFEREKEKIKSKLLETNFKRQLRLWLQSRRDESFIRINE